MNEHCFPYIVVLLLGIVVFNRVQKNFMNVI